MMMLIDVVYQNALHSINLSGLVLKYIGLYWVKYVFSIPVPTCGVSKLFVKKHICLGFWSPMCSIEEKEKEEEEEEEEEEKEKEGTQ